MPPLFSFYSHLLSSRMKRAFVNFASWFGFDTVLLPVGLDLIRKSAKVGLDLLRFSSDFGLDLKILRIFVIDL